MTITNGKFQKLVPVKLIYIVYDIVISTGHSEARKVIHEIQVTSLEIQFEVTKQPNRGKVEMMT